MKPLEVQQPTVSSAIVLNQKISLFYNDMSHCRVISRKSQIHVHNAVSL